MNGSWIPVTSSILLAFSYYILKHYLWLSSLFLWYLIKETPCMIEITSSLGIPENRLSFMAAWMGIYRCLFMLGMSSISR